MTGSGNGENGGVMAAAVVTTLTNNWSPRSASNVLTSVMNNVCSYDKPSSSQLFCFGMLFRCGQYARSGFKPELDSTKVLYQDQNQEDQNQISRSFYFKTGPFIYEYRLFIRNVSMR